MSIGDAAKYETLGVIGRGGMATVFVGRARGAAGFRRLVALKRSHAVVGNDPALAANLRREAELAARLHHPNVVRVIDVVEEENDLVLVLDYVDGGSLSELLRRAQSRELLDARARARAVVRIVLDVAAGLDAAHRTADDDGQPLAIVHRDVSPSNVLVGADGIARLTDFGIAKALEGGTDLTETGELKGKIAYMAPEYLEHHRADALSDQFSLAVVAWEALAARRLFRGPTEIETMKRVVAARVSRLEEIEPLLAPLDGVIARALARSPSDRFASVRELGEALEASARAADLVATHGEVGGLVERALSEELTERRRWNTRATGSEDAAAKSTAPPTIAHGRDDRATASIVRPHARAPSSPPPLRRPSRSNLVVACAIVGVLIAGGAAGVVVRRKSPPPSPPAAIDEASAPSVFDEPAAAGSAVDPALDPALDPAAAGSARSPAPARPVRGKPGGHRPDPSLVPRKAPPNPYVH